MMRSRATKTGWLGRLPRGSIRTRMTLGVAAGIAAALWSGRRLTARLHRLLATMERCMRLGADRFLDKTEDAPRSRQS
jgi:hypothetical protein